MTVISETEVDSINDLLDMCWSGGLDTVKEFDEADKGYELVGYLNEVFFDENPSDTDVNDFLWFDLPETDFYKETLGEDDEDDEDDE